MMVLLDIFRVWDKVSRAAEAALAMGIF